MSNKTIFDGFCAAGMTPEGAAASVGNIAAESGMKPNIAQRGMTQLSDEAYTAAADAGSIDFANDGVGYGICQWTYPPRKANLLAFARASGRSVGDEPVQVAFCVEELRRDWPELWQKLCSSHDLYQLTDEFCRSYENPAHPNVGTRYEYAQQALAAFGSDAPREDLPKAVEEKQTAPDISGALAALAAYLQTEDFRAGFLNFLEGSASK